MALLSHLSFDIHLSGPKDRLHNVLKGVGLKIQNM
jgi:hypothetical protein